MKQDITSEFDIEQLIDTFYNMVFKDPVLAPFFTHMDFDAHKPQMVHFWAFILLDKPGYTTDVTQKHLHMPLKKVHFDRWIEIFNSTIDALFEGEKANTAKQRAFQMRWTMESKLNQ